MSHIADGSLADEFRRLPVDQIVTEEGVSYADAFRAAISSLSGFDRRKTEETTVPDALTTADVLDKLLAMMGQLLDVSMNEGMDVDTAAILNSLAETYGLMTR